MNIKFPTPVLLTLTLCCVTANAYSEEADGGPSNNVSYILGEVDGPGLFETSPRVKSVGQLLALHPVHVPSAQGTVIIRRANPPKEYTLSLNDIEQLNSFSIEPGDSIFVPKLTRHKSKTITARVTVRGDVRWTGNCMLEPGDNIGSIATKSGLLDDVTDYTCLIYSPSEQSLERTREVRLDAPKNLLSVVHSGDILIFKDAAAKRFDGQHNSVPKGDVPPVDTAPRG